MGRATGHIIAKVGILAEGDIQLDVGNMRRAGDGLKKDNNLTDFAQLGNYELTMTVIELYDIIIGHEYLDIVEGRWITFCKPYQNK